VLPSYVHLCPHGRRNGPGMQIGNVVPVEGEVYFETQEAATSILWRAPYGFPAHAIAKLERTKLVGVEQDGLLCLDGDDTLFVLDRNGKSRHVLRTLTPSPVNITVTPEHVVWCSTDEVWRWWRDADAVERLGEHAAHNPILALRPVPIPYPSHRFAPDVAIAAGTRIGLVDAEGLEWLAEAATEVFLFACTSSALYWISGNDLVRFDLDTEHAGTTAQLEGPVMSLAATADVVHVTTNCIRVEMPGDEVILDPPARVTAFDARGQAHAGYLDDASWLRDFMRVFPGPRGQYLVETGDYVDRLTFMPNAWSETRRDATLTLQRWLADGRGGQLAIANGVWWSHGVSGDVPPDITARVNAWLVDNHVNAERASKIPQTLGWQASAANNVWFAANNDRISVNAVAIAELVALLAPHVPPLRLLMKLV